MMDAVAEKALHVLARIEWKRLKIGTDMLLIITSIGDELHKSINMDDLGLNYLEPTK